MSGTWTLEDGGVPAAGGDVLEPIPGGMTVPSACLLN